jgi:hypothetical protein
MTGRILPQDPWRCQVLSAVRPQVYVDETAFHRHVRETCR